jgi:hypothetical protein
MEDLNDIQLYLKLIQEKLEKAMPKVHKEVKVYEEKRSAGKLIKDPIPSPQFGG